MAWGCAAGRDVLCSAYKEKFGRVRCYRKLRVVFASMNRNNGGFWNDCLRLFARTCIHDVVPVIDGENLLPIQPYFYQGLVLLWKPEPINFLVLPYEVGALNPERQFLRG